MATHQGRAVRALREPLAPIVASPVVKWVGGKTKLLHELLARMPAQWGRYYEPFAGGAALFALDFLQDRRRRFERPKETPL